MKSGRTRVFAILVVTALLVPGLAVAGLLNLPSAKAEMDPELVRQLAAAAPNQNLQVFVHSDSARSAEQATKRAGLRLVDLFESVSVAVAVGHPSEIKRVATSSRVQYVQADRPIEFYMQTSHVATRGQDALDGFANSPGVDGSGMSVAVIDSGVDGNHPMFQTANGSKVLLNLKLACASGVLIPLSGPCAGPEGNAHDETFIDMTLTNDTDTPSAGGHGTHVAGIVAGVQHKDLPIHGAAPGVDIISLSVGQVISVYGGAAGLNWVLEHHKNPCSGCPPIKVVNNSWGSGGSFDPNDLRSKLQHALVEQGVTVVWAAGNSGGNGTASATNPPAGSPVPGVLSVANYNDEGTGTRNGKLSSTSSRGKEGSPETYPDISAPGSSITSACNPTLAVCASSDTVTRDRRFGTISGTSMAAPHVAGIVAQLIQAGRQSLGRDLRPEEIEDLLEDNAFKFEFVLGGTYEPDPRNSDNTTSFDKGHGLVDVKKTVAAIRGLDLGAEAGPNRVPLTCSKGGSTMLDGTGDTFIVAVGSTEAPPYEPGLDIVEGRMTWDSASTSLTGVIRVADLGESDGSSAPAVGYYIAFTRGENRYYIEAARSSFGKSFHFGQFINAPPVPSLQQSRLHLFEITGGFDANADTISVTLTNDQLTAADIAPISGGEVFTGISFASRRGLSTDLTTLGPASTDQTSDICQFVVGQGLQPVPPPPAPPPPPQQDSNEADATLSSGETFEADGVIEEAQFEYECSGPNDPVCPTYALQLNPSGATGDLTMWISTDIPAEDYDLFLYDSSGREVAVSGLPGTPPLLEGTVAEGLAPGVYRLVVQPYLVLPESPFHVEASLD